MDRLQTGYYCPDCHRTFAVQRDNCPMDGAKLDLLPDILPQKGHASEINQRYALLRPLGTGGMGVIYKAHDIWTGSPVALKLLKPGLTANDLSVRRFFIEARAVKRLNHPNIVQVLDYGVSQEGYLFITMELLSGRSLGDLLDHDGPMDTSLALRVTQSVAAALEHAHSRGVVHRDLKPDNVMVLDASGELVTKVLDFGVAALLDSRNRGSLYKGEVIGTPAYMSPEQARGKTVDGRSDLYALGVLLYECLTGKVPFYNADPFRTMKMHINDPVPSLGSIQAPYWLSQSLDAMVGRLLAKDREDRPRDAGLVKHSLSRFRARYEAEEGKWDPGRLLRALRGEEESDDLHSAVTLVLPKNEPIMSQKQAGGDPMSETRVVDPDHDSATMVLEQAQTDVTRMRTVDGAWTVSVPPANDHGLPKGVQTLLLSLVHVDFEFEAGERAMLGTRELFRPELDAFERLVMSMGGLVCFDSGDVIRIVFGVLEGKEPGPKTAINAAEDLLDRIRRFTRGTGKAMRVRLGISTGRVPKVSFSFNDPDESLRGSRIDVAARLAIMAEPFGMVVDESTRVMSRGAFTFETLGRIRVRGADVFDRIYRLRVA